MNPTVSIIVPCYNKADYLADALDSVLNQTYSNWECIIINDGSPDATASIANDYLTKDNRFKYYYQENQGVSLARNNGIKLSTGDYILPLDADDIIESTFIEKAINHFELYPLTKLVYSRYDTIGLETGEAKVSNYCYDELLWTCMIPNSSVFRRDDFYKTKGYNPEMKSGYEDWDFLLSFLNKDSIVFRLNEILYHYRKTDNSRNDSANKQSDLLFIQIYRNHKELYEPFAERVIIDHHKLNAKIIQTQEIYNTASYKLGYAILHPLVKAKNMFDRLVGKKTVINK